MSGYLRNMGDNIRMLQRGLADVEDVARYARRRRRWPTRPTRRRSCPASARSRFERRRPSATSRADAPLYDDFSPAHPPGRAGGPGGSDGVGQVDLREAAAAALRRAGRPDPDRRPGHRQGAAGRPAPRHRGGAAGPGAVPPLDRREHRLRAARRDAGRDHAGGQAGARARLHRRPCRRATTPWSASAA